jgi:glycosyltransferase involved in cell wall biosynthesis
MKMRVLHIVNGEHFAGAESVQNILISSLLDDGIKVGLWVVKPGKFLNNVTFEKNNLELLVESADYKQFNLLNEGKRWDVVHVHTPRTLLKAVFRFCFSKSKIVYHLHSPTPYCSSSAYTNFRNSLLEVVLCRLFINKVVMVANSLRWYGRFLKSPSNLSVISNGVKPAKINWNFDSLNWKEPTLSMVALFRYRKGCHVLIRAVEELSLKGININVKLVGDFESTAYQEEIKSLVKTCKLEDRVSYTGFSKDPLSEIVSTNLMVLPSLHGEGLPMVVLEAMSIGIPIVSSDVEGVSEAIKNDYSGFLVEPESSGELAKTIMKALDSKLIIISENAKKDFLVKFSDENMTSSFLGLYKGLYENK